MFGFLPVVFLFFCLLITRRYLENWRAALLFAATITATGLTAITEILSFIHGFSFYPLMITWLFLTAVVVVGAFNLGWTVLIWPPIELKSWFLSEKIFLGIIVFICAVSAVTAAVGMPNTWDSMSYHLPRVEHWIQNKTVYFYPTNIIRQLYITPWAEFAIAHERILGGSETSANFIQWTAMVGSLTGVSLISGQLGANRRGQLMAMAMAACLPMGILQSVSTQTDYVCACWLTVFVYFLIEARRSLAFVHFVAAGLSLGLAFLTKGNSCIFAIPFLVWFIGTNIKQRFFHGLRGLLLIVVCIVAINAGQFWRNTQTFGSPVWTSTPLTNASFDLKVLWVNVLRNGCIHLATPLMDVNEHLVQTMTRAAQWAGADINDPRASFTQDFSIRSLNFDEDYAGNFLHVIVFVVVFVLCWFYRSPNSKIGFYVLCVISSFLLFCLIVRYQPWNCRFHLPLFILFCPVAGFILGSFLKQKSIILGVIFFIGAMPYLFLNNQHPWIGPMSIWKQPKPAQYFYKRPNLALPYVQTTGYLKSIGCRQIGLITGEDSWEYPWWVFLGGKDVRIEHVGVKNASGVLRYPLGNFQACALIAVDTQTQPLLMEGDLIFSQVGSIPMEGGNITIFLRKF